MIQAVHFKGVVNSPFKWCAYGGDLGVYYLQNDENFCTNGWWRAIQSEG
jgi:hypothetical protein